MNDLVEPISPSVRVVVVAHAPLASALRAVALHVHQECAGDVVAVDVDAGWDGQQAWQALVDAVAPQSLQPTLFLVDVLGATPANTVSRLALQMGGNAAVVHGVNVPMLWRTLAYRHEPLSTLVHRALKGGSMGIGQLMPPV